ncbi:MAG: GNAT family N-acetyltransferase [Candidatus Nanopelagicales bacterium]|nr:GNAT family N-acetyltransferase [Candidatus Nanopelagicales bacterium]MBL6834508.1 GNAT family N-acetyltransferase [Candidatus Nanopelagicales bacterium]
MGDPSSSGEPGFVRPATAADATAIAMMQETCWRHDYSWPESIFDAVTASDAELAWARAVIAPPGPAHRLVVATRDGQPVGFAGIAPCLDADAEPDTVEIVAWEVLPAERGAGHGSRLLAALADSATSVGARALSVWIATADDHRLHILRSAGFDSDGAHREIAYDDSDTDDPAGASPVTLRQIRLCAYL